MSRFPDPHPPHAQSPHDRAEEEEWDPRPAPKPRVDRTKHAEDATPEAAMRPHRHPLLSSEWVPSPCVAVRGDDPRPRSADTDEGAVEALEEEAEADD